MILVLYICMIVWDMRLCFYALAINTYSFYDRISYIITFICLHARMLARHVLCLYTLLYLYIHIIVGGLSNIKVDNLLSGRGVAV